MVLKALQKFKGTPKPSYLQEDSTNLSLSLHMSQNEDNKDKNHNTEHFFKKTTAPRIPAWSPTVVLTRRHSG